MAFRVIFGVIDEAVLDDGFRDRVWNGTAVWWS